MVPCVGGGAIIGSGSGIGSTIKDVEKEELRLLRKENRDLKLERDILKKAVGIFSKND